MLFLFLSRSAWNPFCNLSNYAGNLLLLPTHLDAFALIASWLVVFTYNKQFHNVIAVSKADYKNCNVTKPTATWATGKDSVVLNTTGHHYFLCGFPGHCAIGQKVDVRVLSSAAPSTAPAMAPAPAAAGGGSAGRAGAAPSPHANAASAVSSSFAVTVAASVLSVAAAGLNLL
uniref:Mavicyanin n=1 Tax=Aegilops tauschii TaxID=37682 RepID=M8C6K9_AEGTA